VGDNLTDFYLGALGDEDLEGAGGFGKDLRSDFVGFDFKQGIPGSDDVAVLFLPAADHAGGDRFTDGGDFDGNKI
jgi:hypothetical protein